MKKLIIDEKEREFLDWVKAQDPEFIRMLVNRAIGKAQLRSYIPKS